MNRLQLVSMTTDTLDDSYARWLLGQRISRNTVIQRLRFLARVEVEIGNPATITADQIGQWLTPWTGWTLSSYFSAVFSVMTFMQETGRRADHPMRTMRRPRVPKPRPNPLSADEVDLVLAAATGAQRTWLELALYAGLRSHEIAKVCGEDITAATVYVNGKGGKIAFLPTHERLWQIAQTYPARGYWFPSSRPAGHISSDWVSTKTSLLFDRLGLAGSIHRVRATYGTTLLRNGANIKVVQTLMRHDSLSSTEHYLGVDESELSDAINGLRAA